MNVHERLSRGTMMLNYHPSFGLKLNDTVYQKKKKNKKHVTHLEKPSRLLVVESVTVRMI